MADSVARREEPRDLEELLDRIGEAARGREEVSLDRILDLVGRRSYGPVLLVAGILTLAPIVGDIPGVPTLIGLMVLMVVVQLLFGRENFWLPHWLLKRSADRDKLCKAVGWMRRPAAFVDRFIKPRLVALTRGPAVHAIGIACAVIAAAMPPMELVPFSANAAGAALTAFGLALVARDGLLALVAFTLTGLTIGIVGYNLLG